MNSTSKPSRGAAEDTSALIEDAVQLRNGITNELISELCQRICEGDENNNFIGVYAVDEIPTSYLRTRDNFSIIVNLAARSKRELIGHFVCIAANAISLIYIDSFGLPNMFPGTRELALQCRRPQFVQQTQLQSFESQYCGLYAALFASYFNASERRLKLHFAHHPTAQNDEKCVRYLHELIDEIYDS